MSYIRFWQEKIEKKTHEEPVKSLLLESKKKHDGKQKPVVFFIGDIDFIIRNENWIQAKLYALNHYNLPIGIVNTSAVFVLNDDGSFETYNTLYKPLPDESSTDFVQPAAQQEVFAVAA